MRGVRVPSKYQELDMQNCSNLQQDGTRGGRDLVGKRYMLILSSGGSGRCAQVKGGYNQHISDWRYREAGSVRTDWSHRKQKRY